MKLDKIKIVIALGVTLLLSFAVVMSWIEAQEITTVESGAQDSTTNSLSVDSLRYPVSGVLRSEKMIDVKAKQAGVVRQLLVTEGQRVEAGQVLAVQASPVLEAKLGQQAVAALVTELTSFKQVLVAESGAVESKLRAGQAVTLVNLQDQAQTVQLARLSEQVEAGLGSFIATVPVVLRFVQDNKTLFTSESRQQYDSALISLYATAPSYLKVVNITRGSDTDIPTLAAIELLAKATSTADLVLAANQALVSLDGLNETLALSQSEFLDKNTLATSDSRYAQYLENRETLLSLKQSLSEAVGGLEALRDVNEIGSYTRQVDSQLAKVEEVTADSLAGVSKNLAVEMQNLSAAERAVLLAELQEGMLRAPYAGVVSKVLVEDGEYVLSGTPLLRLVDTENIELSVTVPAIVGVRISTGAKVYQDTVQIGEVVRQSGVAEAGSQTIYIKPKSGLVGNGFYGELEIGPTTEFERVVSRRLLQFGTSGPFVETVSGVKVPVKVLFDAGKQLLVELRTEISDELVPAVGSRL